LAQELERLLVRIAECMICGARSSKRYCTRPSLFRAGLTITYEECLTCATVFRNPRPGDDARLKAYQEKTPDDVNLNDGWDERSRLHYRFVLERARRLSSPGRRLRILDFGCGAGGFLRVAKEMGLESEGVEVARALARHTASRVGVKVFEEPLPHPSFPGRPFSLVFSSMVFEHLTDPVGTLRTLREVLVPGGLVVVEVPNLLHFRERIRRGSTLDDSHLFYFSPRSIRHLFEAAGMQLLRVEDGLRLHAWIGQTGVPVPFAAASVLERLCARAGLRTALTAYGRLAPGKEGP